MKKSFFLSIYILTASALYSMQDKQDRFPGFIIRENEIGLTEENLEEEIDNLANFMSMSTLESYKGFHRPVIIEDYVNELDIVNSHDLAPSLISPTNAYLPYDTGGARVSELEKFKRAFISLWPERSIKDKLKEMIWSKCEEEKLSYSERTQLIERLQKIEYEKAEKVAPLYLKSGFSMTVFVKMVEMFVESFVFQSDKTSPK